jgi:hypothetical protein
MLQFVTFTKHSSNGETEGMKWSGHAACVLEIRDIRAEGKDHLQDWHRWSVVFKLIFINIRWKDANFEIVIALFLLRIGVFWDLMPCPVSHLRTLESQNFAGLGQ